MVDGGAVGDPQSVEAVDIPQGPDVPAPARVIAFHPRLGGIDGGAGALGQFRLDVLPIQAETQGQAVIHPPAQGRIDIDGFQVGLDGLDLAGPGIVVFGGQAEGGRSRPGRT
jgi:hypothetical protein